MEIIRNLKQLLKNIPEEKKEKNENENEKEKEKEKIDFQQISKLLNDLYNIEDIQNPKKKFEKFEIQIRIQFFVENINELRFLRDLFISKGIIDDEKNKEKDEKEGEKDIEKDKKNKENCNINNKEKDKEDKKEIVINKEDKLKLKNTFNNINKFANFIQERNRYIPFYEFKQLVDGFINPNVLKENKFIKIEKEVLDDKQKAEIQYKKILELYKNNTNKIDVLFGKLSNIRLQYLEKEQVDKLIEIGISIFYILTEKQKLRIKEYYSHLIIEEDIREILYLDSKNFFRDADKKKYNEKIKYVIECLSELLVDNSDKNDDDDREKKINRNNISIILLELYKEFLIYNNKEKSYVNSNIDNIKEKFYFYLIINFMTYEDVFEDGTIFYKFLYVKYLYEGKFDFIGLIKNKEEIKKDITIYSKEDLENRQILEENLKNDDLNEYDNEEDDSTPNMLFINLKKIIPEEYFNLYLEVIQSISNFYIIPFPINILVNSSNINFTCHIIDMILFYKRYTNSTGWFNKYKNHLKKLERSIFQKYKESTSDYVDKEGDNKLIGYKINQTMKNAYDSLVNYLISRLPKNKNYKIEFIPFGSVTQFLSGKNGDIDLFLNIESEKKDPVDFKTFHQKILDNLFGILKKLYPRMVVHQTNRLCLFTIEYQNIKIDINVYGICSYYGEILLREYSLMDFRFPMLVIYLKYLIGVYNIKNTENEKIYINSFAWTNILLTFLQDILDPPLFPRLLNEKNKRNINITVGGGKGRGQSKKLEEEIGCQRQKKFNVVKLDRNNNIDDIITLKNQFYGKDENKKDKWNNDNYFTIKNKMPASEILLKFVQFIGYFFNYRYTMVNTSYEYQGFMPKIEKIESKDEFVKSVIKKCQDFDNELLIREPFDHTYNPCKSVPPEKLDEIQEKFRKIYINILEKGEI